MPVLTLAELESQARSKLATLPAAVQDAALGFASLATSVVPTDQRDEIKYLVVEALATAIPKAAEKLKIDVTRFLFPTKMAGGFFTAVELRPEHFNLDTFRYNYTSTGEQNCPWNVTTPEKLYIVILGLKNPEPSPKTRMIYGKIGVDDLPTYGLADLQVKEDPNWIKKLPRYFLIPPQTSIELKVNVEAEGYDALQPWGFALLPADLAAKPSKTAYGYTS